MTSSLSAPRRFLVNALIWALPAILIGAVVRWWFCQYSPYGYWGSDSESFFALAYRYWAEDKWLMQEKREYVYPFFIWLMTHLPGAPLKVLVFLQHSFGLLTLIPLAYFIQFVTRAWKLWVIPVTVIYACLPVIVWYEHELLAETLFTAFLVWSMGAWAFWQRERDQGRGLWWHWFCFLLPFALFCLTKPSARFVWPGLIVALIYLKVWKHFRYYHWIATAAVAIGTFTLGESSQGNRLLYSSFFPLTNLESSKHQKYKAEIKEMVLDTRANLDTYYMNDMPVKRWLRGGFKDKPEFQAWDELYKKDKDEVSELMQSLAVEAILKHPLLSLKHVTSRVVGSLDLSQFKLRRFEYDYSSVRYDEDYEKFKHQAKNVKMLDMVMGLGQPTVAPDPKTFRNLTAPEGKEVYVTRITKLMEGIVAYFNPTTTDEPDKLKVKLSQIRPTWSGVLLILGLLVAVLHPAYRSGIGLWVVISVSYIYGVHFVGSLNPRFSMQILAMMFILMTLPLDALLGRFFKRA